MSKSSGYQRSESYAQILRSTSIMGSTALLTFLIGVIRTKSAALMIGTAGFGLMTALVALSQMIGVLAGMGLQMSSVREIAVASGANDQLSISRIVLSLRRVSLLTGAMGLLLMVLLAPILSALTFGHEGHAEQIAALGITIFLGNLAGAELGIIQGLRRVGVLARANLIGFGLSTIWAIGCFAALGIRGVVPALIAGAITRWLVARYYSRRVSLSVLSMTWRESIFCARGMLRLGLAFMSSTLIVSFVALAINALVARNLDLEAVGLFGAAFAVSAMLVNFVLRAMGTDFYPRLAEKHDDHSELNRLANEQIEAGILLALPGMTLMLGLSSWLLLLLYSEDFIAANSLVGWLVLGSMIRVISWPMGFIIRALGREIWFISTIALFQATYFLVAWIGLHYLRLEGVALGFLIMNLLALMSLAVVTNHLTGFVFTSSTLLLIGLAMTVCIVTFISLRILPAEVSPWFAIAMTLGAGFFCTRGLVNRLGDEHAVSKIARRIPFLVPSI